MPSLPTGRIVRRTLSVAALGAAALLAGCVSSGMGGGDIVGKDGRATTPVLFAWQSRDGGITGTLTATLPDGTYQGRFLQITRQTTSDAMAPMWEGWGPGWGNWPYWGWGGPAPFDAVQFSTVYSGKVIANLKSGTGRLMRCRLHMMRPDAGMGGGGTGECQVAGGPTIQANF